ncbi:MAG: serine protease [Calothrix sp. MO_167.B42]|nr:serine protease [Calothrix sp. MO_167.B42]
MTSKFMREAAREDHDSDRASPNPSHNRGRKSIFITAVLILALVFLCFVPTSTALAQEGKGNWMSDYVELRTYSRTLRALKREDLKRNIPDFILRPTDRIVGGFVAGTQDNPFQVGLLTKSIADNFQAQFCGGTLIKPNIVVTAAHCSDFITADQVQVLTGTRRLDGSGNRYDVSRIAIHPDWNDSTFDNDVAVWELSSNATGIPLAELATSDGSVGDNLFASGWGTLTEGGSRPIDLHAVGVPLVERSNCNDDNSYNGNITENMICAGFDIGGKDSCQGDSGGPLTKGNVLTGITSWGNGCARANLFGVYARVSRDGIRNFIENNSGAGVEVSACSLCHTCGGHWPNYSGTIGNIIPAPSYAPIERGDACSGSLSYADDTHPYLCCQ